MKAMEIQSKTDKKGRLSIKCQLDVKESNVRVLVLLDDEKNGDDENLWLDGISRSPSFEYLQHPDEDIYTLEDGVSFND